jgi:hypothetical protein
LVNVGMFAFPLLINYFDAQAYLYVGKVMHLMIRVFASFSPKSALLLTVRLSKLNISTKT